MFDHSIRSQKNQPEPGDLAVVFDDNRRFVGIGLADPDSPIAIRMLHHGTSATIDAAFFAAKLDAAIEIRTGLIDDPKTSGFRLVNGENDGLPGLVIDEYAGVLVAKIYTPAWLPHLDPILDHVVARRSATAVVLRASRAVQASLPDGEAAIVRGSLTNQIVMFAENGLTFTADVVAGNKTGHFLDQRDNRQRVRDLAEGRSVLDVFSSTGGFSVYGAAGGATGVTTIDISPGALDAATANMESNGLMPIHGHEILRGDAFEQMTKLRRAKRRFDLVVVDPPSFAPKQRDAERARSSYRRLTRAALDLIGSGGYLVQASCSARVTEDEFIADVEAELHRSGRPFGDVRSYGHPIDHPVTFAEGRYLKALFARIG